MLDVEFKQLADSTGFSPWCAPKYYRALTPGASLVFMIVTPQHHVEAHQSAS
jgi:hypothetical protein